MADADAEALAAKADEIKGEANKLFSGRRTRALRRRGASRGAVRCARSPTPRGAAAAASCTPRGSQTSHASSRRVAAKNYAAAIEKYSEVTLASHCRGQTFAVCECRACRVLGQAA